MVSTFNCQKHIRCLALKKASGDMMHSFISTALCLRICLQNHFEISPVNDFLRIQLTYSNT